MAKTFGSQYAAGVSSGFDYLRVILATCVIVWHSFIVAYGSDFVYGLGFHITWSFVGFILPSFFALSGFLVAGSVERTKTIEGFATLRAIRLVPALAVEILLSALVLGPILTTVDWASYFSDSLFYTYFLNIIGVIHYHLPGLFENNPEPGTVNLSLWTVPYELHCYLWLIAFVVLGIFKRRRIFLAAVILFSIALPISHYSSGVLYRPINIVPHRILEISFLCGVLFFLYRDKIPQTTTLLWVAIIASMATLAHPMTQYLCVVPITYVTVWLGLTGPKKVAFLKKGDYSYGMYLFAFPIQQVIAQFEWGREWWSNTLLTLPLCVAYAMFSWHCVEYPVLRKKKQIVAFVERIGAGVRRPFRHAIASLRTNSAT